MSCQSLTVGLGLLVKPDYLPSLLSHKLQKLSTKPKLSSRFLQLSEWQVILDCPTSSNMDHHGMCVFCEDMQNGYTSSNIKTCFLNLLVFYPPSVFLLGHFTNFISVEAFSFTKWKPQISQKGQGSRTVGRKSEVDVQRVVRLFHQSGVHSCWVELKIWLQWPGVRTH